MNERLQTIVDLENYPIHDLSSKKIQKLIKKCKDDLDQFSCSTIPNFILPKSITGWILLSNKERKPTIVVKAAYKQGIKILARECS